MIKEKGESLPKEKMIAEKTRRGFFFNFAGHPTDDAFRYVGQIINVTEGNLDLRNTDRIMYTVKSCFQRHGFNPKTDYLIPAGSPLVAIIVMDYLGANYFNDGVDYQLLVWEPKLRQYYERTLEWD